MNSERSERAEQPTRRLSVVVLSAGLSQPSSTRMLADLLSSTVRDRLAEAGVEADVRTVELREHAREITDAMLARIPGESLAYEINQLRDADAVIAATPIFNTGASGLFKSFIDVVETDVWRGKPVLLGATAGTARHSLALEYGIRPMFVYLKAEIVPTAIFAAASDFGTVTESEADELPLTARARRAAEELVALLKARHMLAQDAERRSREKTCTRLSDDVHNDEPPEQDLDLEAEGAESADKADGAGAPSTGGSGRPRRQLDAEFSDFTPMDQLLGGKH